MRITFEFVGGPHDGKVVVGDRGEPTEANRLFLFTHHGRVGQRLKTVSELAVETLADGGLQSDVRHAFQQHFYVVEERLEDDHDVYVRVCYEPGAKPTPKA